MMWAEPPHLGTQAAPDELGEGAHLGATSDRTQALLWAWLFVFLVGLLLTSVAFGLRATP